MAIPLYGLRCRRPLGAMDASIAMCGAAIRVALSPFVMLSL